MICNIYLNNLFLIFVNNSVKLPLTVWIEWIVCVPLMAFSSVLVNESKPISWDDFKIIFSLFLCIFFAFLNNFHKVRILSVIFLILSCLANLYAMKIAFVEKRVDDIFSPKTIENLKDKNFDQSKNKLF